MHSMAIKIDASKEDQENISQLLEKAGFPHQRRKYHCTIGFIEKSIPGEESVAFGQKITQEVQEFIDAHPLFYEVEKVVHLFGHVICFIPTEKSLASLREVNHWLGKKVKDLSEGCWELNEETQAETYIPHMTLWRSRRLDARFKLLEEVAQTHPTYHLSKAAYVIFRW